MATLPSNMPSKSDIQERCTTRQVLFVSNIPHSDTMSAPENQLKSSSLGSEHASSPGHLGYRLPAEWEPHEGTWLSWPHNQEAWPARIQTEKMQAVYRFFAELVRAIASDEAVHINVNDIAMERLARDVLKKQRVAGHIQFHPFVTDNAWCRDHAATIVTHQDESSAFPTRVAIDWAYNGYGNRTPRFENDNAIPSRMARAMQIPCVSGGMTLEGSAIDANGQGAVLAAKSCLLDRNPTADLEQLEERLRTMVSAQAIFWLAESIAGDMTVGHVDRLARFIDPCTVVTALATNHKDENFRSLHRNLERLQGFELPNGNRLRIQTIPMPPPIFDGRRRLPATYLGFYITNHSVLVPTFRQPTDDEACQRLGELFPRRQVTGIDCLDVLPGLGGLHSFAQQIPVA